MIERKSPWLATGGNQEKSSTSIIRNSSSCVKPLSFNKPFDCLFAWFCPGVACSVSPVRVHPLEGGSSPSRSFLSVGGLTLLKVLLLGVDGGRSRIKERAMTVYGRNVVYLQEVMAGKVQNILEGAGACRLSAEYKPAPASRR